jgi:hypothetical protein
MKNRVVGLDVSKDNVTVCLLETIPDDPRDIYLENRFLRLYTSAQGIKDLLVLNPTVAVLEPTGVNYSKFWVTKLAEQGVKIALVGHTELRMYRKTLNLPDKDDEADSLALACYYLQFHKSANRFVRKRDDVVTHMRDLVLRYQHLNRVQNPLVNRLRQDLAWAFPERSKTQLGGLAFWGWLAGVTASKKYDSELERTCGLGLSDHIRENALILHKVNQRQMVLDLELRECLKDDRFESYRKVLAMYGFGHLSQALIISQIYPLENYLKDGQPIVIVSRSRQNALKTTRKKVSERKFVKALGMAPRRENSGDKSANFKAGSKLCRVALWQWIFVRIEVKRNRLINERFLILSEEFDRYKESGLPIKLIRSKICAKCVKMLFYDLLREISATE